MHKEPTQIKGLFGEELVVAMIKNDGFTIRARNFKRLCGEIDIIAMKEKLLIFIEVKMRTSDTVDLGELIGFSKKRKIIATAHLFLSEQYDSYYDCVCRFDVALITVIQGKPEISYVKNAFFENE